MRRVRIEIVGTPIPAAKVRPGDRIKILIEQAPCVVLQSLQGSAPYIRVEYDGAEIHDVYLGEDHTVWLLPNS